MQKSGRGTFFRHLLLTAASIAGLMQMQAADAIQFSLDYGSGIEGTLNTAVTFGGAIRTQGRAQDLLGKANLNPNVCGGAAQSCQGVFKDQYQPARTLALAPGAASANADDGDWNYHRGAFVEAPLKVTQDLKITYGSLGFFAKALYFYDFVNNNFTEYHPNRVTPQNKASVGTRGDLTGANLTFDQVFGPGAVVRNKRTDGEVLRQIGTDFQLFDAYLYGQIPIGGERNLTFKIGRQTVNWGQSLVFPINSINQVNPVNANNLFRTGFTLEELYQPIGMVFLSTEPFQGATLEGFYDLEWQPVEAPAPGSFYSSVDIGTNNAINTVGINFGGNAEDPNRVATPQENPLSGLTNTTVTMLREPDREPKRWGQFGVSFRYYAENLNNGTDLGFYYMNYHSQLPYLSTHAANASCARAEGNSLGLNAYDPISLIVACPDLPITHLHGVNGGPDAATSNAVPIDTVKFFLEYPENIHLFGLAFATTLGDYSIQGEVAYRPNAPMQIATADIAFASLQPMLTRCHDPNLPRILPTGVNTSAIQNAIGSIINALGLNIGIPNLAPVGNGCTGSTVGAAVNPDTGLPFGPSDFVPAPGVAAYKDTFDLLVGHADGSARSFPSFLVAYRGGKQGEVAPNSYIQGYERFKTFQFNIGLTKVIGATDNFIGADQVIMVGEFGANWTPGLPAFDVLQIQGPGAYYHASAGADGSGADGSRQACSTTPDCSVGPDGLRFNPHQQSTDGFADRFSWGYRLIAMIRYESVFPGISFAPRIILRHDVHGTMPDPAATLVEGRKEADVQFEIRYKEALSFTPGYTWFTGGGQYNLLRDRDFAEFFVKYQF